jgi:DNA-binding NtrC family response regulator
MFSGNVETLDGRIRAALEADARISPHTSLFHITPEDQRIVLEGHVDDARAKRIAGGLVRDVVGRRYVVENRLDVRGDRLKKTVDKDKHMEGSHDGGAVPADESREFESAEQTPPLKPVRRTAALGPEAFVGRSEAAQRLRLMIQRLAEVPFSGLVISGETGTGKGLVARILHQTGPRSDGPMIEVNCAALPRELLESELFGHEAGAFTGARGRHRGYLEQANGGTLFLDEIGEMDPDLQAKLLTAIEDRRLRRVGGEKSIEVDVQVVVASNCNLDQAVHEGQFRSDLYHRLSVFKLDLPALRTRIEDLEDLVPVMVAEFNATAGRSVDHVPGRVYEQMRAYRWPGNVRELRNVVERCVLLAEGRLFPEQWLQLGRGVTAGPSVPGVQDDRLIIPLDGSMALDEMDSFIIRTALERNRFNVTQTARALGTTRETLRYRIQKYGLAGNREGRP